MIAAVTVFALFSVALLIVCSVKKIVPNTLTCSIVSAGGFAFCVALALTVPNEIRPDVNILPAAALLVTLVSSINLMQLNLRHHFKMKALKAAAAN